MEKNKSKYSSEKKKWSPLKITLVTIFSIILVFILTMGVFAIGIYKYDWNNSTTEAVTRIIPFPAALVNWKNVKVYDYRTLYKFRKSYNDFKEVKLSPQELKELKTNVLDELIDREIIRQEAKKLGISITNQELDTQYKDTIQANGGENKVKEFLKKSYNETLEEFKDELKIQLLIKKVEEKVTSNESFNAPVRAKAENVLKQMKAGADFAEMAKKYSQNATAASGGDLGWIGKKERPKEFEDVVFSLADGQTSDIIKDIYGYHIVEVLETRTNENGELEVRAREILIKTRDFSEWLKDKRSSAKIWKFIK